MAYMNQELKAKLAANLKKVVPKDWKYSLRVTNHSGITMQIKEAPVDLLGYLHVNSEYVRDYACLNTHGYKSHFKGAPEAVVDQIGKIITALNDGNHDNSDIQTDYFDVGWYVSVEFGAWDSPFVNTDPAIRPVG